MPDNFITPYRIVELLNKHSKGKASTNQATHGLLKGRYQRGSEQHLEHENLVALYPEQTALYDALLDSIDGDDHGYGLNLHRRVLQVSHHKTHLCVRDLNSAKRVELKAEASGCVSATPLQYLVDAPPGVFGSIASAAAWLRGWTAN